MQCFVPSELFLKPDFYNLYTALPGQPFSQFSTKGEGLLRRQRGRATAFPRHSPAPARAARRPRSAQGARGHRGLRLPVLAAFSPSTLTPYILDFHRPKFSAEVVSSHFFMRDFLCPYASTRYE